MNLDALLYIISLSYTAASPLPPRSTVLRSCLCSSGCSLPRSSLRSLWPISPSPAGMDAAHGPRGTQGWPWGASKGECGAGKSNLPSPGGLWLVSVCLAARQPAQRGLTSPRPVLFPSSLCLGDVFSACGFNKYLS